MEASKIMNSKIVEEVERLNKNIKREIEKESTLKNLFC